MLLMPVSHWGRVLDPGSAGPTSGAIPHGDWIMPPGSYLQAPALAESISVAAFFAAYTSNASGGGSWTIDGIQVSVDGGATWTEIARTADYTHPFSLPAVSLTATMTAGPLSATWVGPDGQNGAIIPTMTVVTPKPSLANGYRFRLRRFDGGGNNAGAATWAGFAVSWS